MGATDVVTNRSGTVAETLDYYPYGGIRLDSKTNYGGAKYKYAGTQYDAGTGLDYAQQRYYNSARGTFISEDRVPMVLGDQTQIQQITGQSQQAVLADPQQLNFYGYARDNPITKSDPSGKWYKEFVTGQQSWPSFQTELGQASNQLAQSSSAWNFAFNHPYATGRVVGLLAVPAATAGVEGTVALGQAAYPGVSTAFSAAHLFAGTAYLYLAQDSLKTIPDVLSEFDQVNFANPSLKSFSGPLFKTATQVAPSFAGENVGAAADVFSLVSAAFQATKNTIQSEFSAGASSQNSNASKNNKKQ
jgi:RHS repeat-associated protein